VAFMFFFTVFIVLLLIIGFFPRLKSHFTRGTLKESMRMTFLWLISTVFAFISFFQLRRAYQVLEHYEDFWQAMMFLENFLTGILLVLGFIFSFMIYKHYRENIWRKFGIITSYLMFLFSVFNLLRLSMIYFIHEVLLLSEIMLYGVVLGTAVLLYLFTRRYTDYSLDNFFKDVYE